MIKFSEYYLYTLRHDLLYCCLMNIPEKEQLYSIMINPTYIMETPGFKFQSHWWLRKSYLSSLCATFLLSKQDNNSTHTRTLLWWVKCKTGLAKHSKSAVLIKNCKLRVCRNGLVGKSLSLDPLYLCKKSSIVPCFPRAGAWRPVGPWGSLSDQPVWARQRAPDSVRYPVLKTKVEKRSDVDLWLPYISTCASKHACIHDTHGHMCMSVLTYTDF